MWWSRRRQRPAAPCSAVVRLCDRIYAIPIDEERKRWKQTISSAPQVAGGKISDRHREQLCAAAEFLGTTEGGLGHSLVVNIGPSWRDSSAHDLFEGNVIELPTFCHEKPPGVGVLPLDIIFAVCSSVQSWLSLSKKNVVLLHHQGSAGNSMEVLRFVAGCLMAYTGELDGADREAGIIQQFHLEQQESFKIKRENMQPREGFFARVKDHHNVGSSQHGQGLGFAQQLYAQYMVTILYAPSLPPLQNTALHITSVVIGGLHRLKRGLKNVTGLDERTSRSVLHPVLLIYQRGVEIFAGRATKKGDVVEFNVQASVAGDIMLGMWYVKDHIAGGEPPLVAFAFHTSFVDPGVMKVTAPSMHLNKRAQSKGDELCHLFMELSLSETDKSVDDVLHKGKDLLDLGRMRRVWEYETSAERQPPVSPMSSSSEDAGTESTSTSTSDCNVHPSTPTSSPELQARVDSEGSQNALERALSLQHWAKDGAEDRGEECDRQPELSSVAVPANVSLMISPDDAPQTPSMSEGCALPRVNSSDADTASEAGPSSECSVSVDAHCHASSPTAAPPPPPPPPPPRAPRPPLQAPPPPPPPPGKKMGSKAVVKHVHKRGNSLRKLRSFYWTKTPKQSGTVWSELPADRPLPAGMDNLLEDFFSAEVKPPAEGMPTRAPQHTETRGNKKGFAQVIPTTRANNVSIMMKRFANFENGVQGILQAVLDANGLTNDELSLVQQIAPTDDEAALLREYQGPHSQLSMPEGILLRMSMVPRFKMKCKVLTFMHQWQSLYEDTVSALHTIKVACQQIRESDRLRRVFECVLMVGNALNRGTHRGNAGGVRVQSLLTLKNYKITGANDRRTPSPSGARDRRSPSPTQLLSKRLATLLNSSMGVQTEDLNLRSLLDFVVVVVHKHEPEEDYCPGQYLADELGDLAKAGPLLDGAIKDLQDEIDAGMSMVEAEFKAIYGKSWESVKGQGEAPSVASQTNVADGLCENKFGPALFEFLKTADMPRGMLRQEASITDQHLRSASSWLGEPENGNPKETLKNLLTFTGQFDATYDWVAQCF